MPLDPALIHPQEHKRPVAGLGAAGAGVDAHERVLPIVRAAEHQAEAELLEAGIQSGHLTPDLGERGLVVLGLGKLAEQLRLFAHLLEGDERLDLALEALHLAHAGLRRFRVRPEVRLLDLALYRLYLFLGRRDVKESP